MSAASTQQQHHGCSSGCSPSEHAQSSSSGRSRHSSPTTHDHHMTSPRQPTQMPLSSTSTSAVERTWRQSSHEPQSSQRQAPINSDAPHHASARSSPQNTHMANPNSASATAPPAGGSQQHQQSNRQSASGSVSVPQQIRLPTAAQRRRARELATVLLTLATCQGCSRPVQDPVTLPCGHSSCLQCIKDRVLPRSVPSEEQVQPLPCLSHLPPRLPLSPMTVPCPAHGCPRSAIGRGIGVWAGHQPRYGLIPTYTERLPLGQQDVGPGAPPVDGFVMGVADHPLRLTVIGPQTRSKAHLFAVPPQGVEPASSAAGAGAQQAAATLLPSLATSNMLRTDVTLSKAVAILKCYASSPLPRPPRQRRSLAGSSGPSSSSSSRSRYTRRSAAHGSNDQSNTSLSSGIRSRGGLRSRAQASGRPGARGLVGAARSSMAAGASGSSSVCRTFRPGSSHAGMGIFGRNESDLESGTVGGVRAASESDDDGSPRLSGAFADDSDDSPTADTAHEKAYRRALNRNRHGNVERGDDEDGWTLHAGTDDERTEEEDDRLWPDHVGGAFSRPPISSTLARRRGKAKLKRRRGRRSDDSLSSGNSLRRASASHTDGKVARRDHADSTEEVVARQVDSGWSTEDSTVSNLINKEGGAEALVDSVRRHQARQLHGAVSTSSDAETDLDAKEPNARKHAIEAKHSLALSSKLGANGEPLIQTVATLHAELVEVLECQLCYLLLYDPLTTPCGHTFCKSCFARSLDHGDRCPLCRADMPNFSFFQDHKPNSALLKVLTSDTATFSDEDAMDSDSAQETKNAVLSTYAGISIAMGSNGEQKDGIEGRQRAGYIIDDDPESSPHHYGFKRLYEQRKTAIEQEEREARLSTPIFVCTLAFPGMPTILHIFEPRYRLMVRRCLESGNPRFGMVLPSRNNGGTEEYGTMLEIKSVQMLADGRSMLETVGSYRFRLLEKGSLDGYTVGRVERVDDISLEEEAELERAVLVRRTELERKKAAEAAERPRSFPMIASSSAPVRTQPADAEGAVPSGVVSSRPEMSRHESDALSIYRTAPPAEEATNTQQQADHHHHSANDESSQRNPSEQETERDAEAEDENGLMPFKPVPAQPSIEELTEICTSFIETLRSGSAPWLLSRLNHTYGPMPNADEVERLGYWMALVMPIDEHEKAKLLPIRSRRLRLCLVVHWIEQLRQSWWFNSGCTVS